MTDDSPLLIQKLRLQRGWSQEQLAAITGLSVRTEYVVLVGFLVVVNLLTFPRYFWAGWVAVAWGLALVLHGLRAFDRIPFLNADWEKRTVEKYLGRKL